MVYYLSRMVSSQKEAEFIHSDYDKLKRVKSIFICMDSKKASIVRYSFHPELIFSESAMTDDNVRHKLRIERQMEGIIVRIRRNQRNDAKNELISLLEDLLHQDSATTKKEKLRRHGIQITESIDGRILSMCDYSAMIREQGQRVGRRKGLERGLERGLNQGLTDQVRILKSLGIPAIKAYGLITESPNYQNITLEQVEKLYQ